MKVLSAIIFTIFFLFFADIAVKVQETDDLSREMAKILPEGGVILLEINEGRLLAWHGKDLLLRPASPGSILKIFVTEALLAAGEKEDKVYFCPPSSVDTPSTQACWYKPGHGNLTLKGALAYSCNSWFRQWLSGRELNWVSQRYGDYGLHLPEPASEEERVKMLTGMSSECKATPLALALAAAALFNGGNLFVLPGWQPGTHLLPLKKIKTERKAVEFIEKAMLEGSNMGTAKGKYKGDILFSLKTKTGTAAALEKGENGELINNPLKVDGWALMLFSHNGRELLLLVVLPGSTGSEAAAAGAKIVRKVVTLL